MQKKTGIDLCQFQSFGKPVQHHELRYNTPYSPSMVIPNDVTIRRKKLICFMQKNIHRCGIGERVNLIKAFSTFLLGVVEELK